MKNYVLRIAPNCQIEKIEFPEEHDFRWYGQQIGCEWIEIVHPVGYGCVLIVDEEGLLKPNVVNPIASYMYGTHKHGEPIVGTCLLMKEGIVNGEPDLIGMPEEDADKIAMLLGELHYA